MFSTDLNLPGGNECVSLPFSVGVGPANNLVVLEEPSNCTVLGGKAFTFQPRVQVIDAGQNPLLSDSSLVVVASIHSNPSGGNLYPIERISVPVTEGIAQFRNLSIDKAGNGYKLMYSLWQKDGLGILTKTDISSHGKLPIGFTNLCCSVILCLNRNNQQQIQ